MNRMGSLKLILIGWAVITLPARGGEEPVIAIQQAILKEGADWEAGETSISILPPEVRRQLCGLLPEPPDSKLYGERTLGVLSLPSAWDWRNHEGKDWMTPIRDQGPCGSCWAFGALGALEGLINIQTEIPDQSLDLSEQYLLSCSDGSCYGWYMSSTCQFLKEAGAVNERCLPYYASDLIPCDDRCEDWRFRLRRLKNWGWVRPDINSIKTEIMDGPVYVGFRVYTDFFYYRRGVYKHVWGSYEGMHAVVMLGWDDKDSAWICKNSWGTGWGERGWFRIKYKECGIEEDVIWMEPADNRWPWLEYAGSDYIELKGDGDGNLNPGETISWRVSLYNHPSGAPAENLVAVLSSPDPKVRITDSIGTYPPIQRNETRANIDDPFQLEISKELGVCELTMGMELRANQGLEYPCTTEIEVPLEITLNQRGWPVLLERAVLGSPALINIAGDPRSEVVVAGLDGLLYVKSADGSDSPGFPYRLDGMVFGSPAVGDLDSDGDLELVVGTWKGSIHFINSDGSEFIPPVETPDRFVTTPALSDIDSDGDLEVAIGSRRGDLYLLNHDGSSYSPQFPFSVGAKIKTCVAVADLDQDRRKEVIVAASDGRVWAITPAGTPLGGWPVLLDEPSDAAPSVAELGGGPKVVVNSGENLYILNPDGTRYLKLPLGEGDGNSPTFVDLEGDGDLEIVSSSANRLWIHHHDGTPAQGWPQEVSKNIRTAVSFADLDRDQRPELVFGAGEELWAFHTDGKRVASFPIPTRGSISSSPAIAHLDCDSDLEIGFGNESGIQMIDVKTRAGSNRYWNMYRANPHRTGNYGDLPYGITEPAELQPDIPYFASQNQPNPFKTTTVISYSLPVAGWVQLHIYNVAGQRVATLIDGYEKAGVRSVEWDASQLPAGIYFYRFTSGGFYQVRKMILLR